MGTNLIPSFDSDTKQLRDDVRARIAANLSDPATVEGAAVADAAAGSAPTDATFATFLTDPNSQSSTAVAARYASQLTSTADTSTAAINAWLAAGTALGVTAVKRLVGTANITAPLVVRSGTHFDATGATISSNFAGNLVQNAANGNPVRSVTDAALTAGSTVLTSASASFTAADVGRSVVIANGIAAGSPLCAVINTVTDAATAVLSVPALATINTASASIYTRDTNITLTGGTWIRGGGGGSGPAAHSVLFRRVDGLRITNLTINTTNGKYAIALGDINRFTVDNVRFNSASDGLHMNGPCTNGVVSNIQGKTGDDAVAMTATDYGTYNDVVGPITNIVVRNVIADTGSTVAVKLTSGTGTYLDAILIDGVQQLNASGIAVGFADDTGPLDVRRVTARNLIGAVSSNTPSTGTASVIQALDLENVRRDHPSSNSTLLNINCTVQDLTGRALRSVAPAGATGNHLLTVGGTGSINRLLLRDIRHVGQSANTVHLSASGATVNDTTISGLFRDGLNSSGSAVNAATSGVVLGRFRLDSAVLTNTAWLADIAVTTVLHLANVKHTAGINLRGTANVTVYCVASELGNSAVAAGGVLRSKGFDFPADLSVLAKNNGDMATNTNASLTCGLGPAVSNGTNWKNLYSGTTY